MATDNQGDAVLLILVRNMANLVGGMRLCNAGTGKMQLADLERETWHKSHGQKAKVKKLYPRMPWGENPFFHLTNHTLPV